MDSARAGELLQSLVEVVAQRRIGREQGPQVFSGAADLAQGTSGLGERIGDAVGQGINAAVELLAHQPVLVQGCPHGGQVVGNFRGSNEPIKGDQRLVTP